MKLLLKKSWLVMAAALAVVLLSSSLMATQPTTTFYLNDAGSGANLGGVYTSPYDGQVNYPSSALMPVICDDFTDNSYTPEKWTAYVTTLPSLLGGTATPSELKWTGSSDGTLNQNQAYQAAAILAIDILNSPTASIAQQEYSFAMWQLFDPAAFADLTSSYGVGNPYQTAAGGFLSSAESAVLNNSINGGSISNYLAAYNVTIYSYDTGAQCGTPLGACPSIPPQEFITVTTPEASTPTLFAIDLLGFVGLLALFRKRAFGAR